jgi:ubiquinone/menaquinone biosynthesis C-methylase UbiE
MKRFDLEAKEWDALERRQALAQAVAEEIMKRFSLDRSMHLLDLGAGTGLLTQRLLTCVGRMTAVDTSAGMLEQLRKKLGKFRDSLILHHGTIDTLGGDERFDGIVSSMTLHHIKEIQKLFGSVYDMLLPGGFVALADLAPEDGTFHDHGNEGVYHFGFAREELERIASDAGFVKPQYSIIHRIDKRPKGIYDLFLFSAIKAA